MSTFWTPNTLPDKKKSYSVFSGYCLPRAFDFWQRDIIFLCHRILLLVCRIINNLTIFSPLVVKKWKKKTQKTNQTLIADLFVTAWSGQTVKCLTCTATPAIPPPLEDRTDQNSDGARELQNLGRGMVATVTACCWGSTLLGDNTGKEHFTLEQRGEILPITMTKMRTPAPRHTYKHELREHHFHMHIND